MSKRDPRTDPVRGTILRRLMELCKSKGLSQSGLANKLGVERQTVYKWFTSNENIPPQVPNEANLLGIAKLFETSVSYLYGETNDPGPPPLWRTDESFSPWQAKALELREHLDAMIAILAKSAEEAKLLEIVQTADNSTGEIIPGSESSEKSIKPEIKAVGD